MSIWLLLLTSCCAAEPVVRIQPAAELGHVEVVARLPEALQRQVPSGRLTQDQGEKWLRLVVVNDTQDGPAILGTYERRQDTLLLWPRYPLVAGHTYRATLMIGAKQTA